LRDADKTSQIRRVRRQRPRSGHLDAKVPVPSWLLRWRRPLLAWLGLGRDAFSRDLLPLRFQPDGPWKPGLPSRLALRDSPGSQASWLCLNGSSGASIRPMYSGSGGGVNQYVVDGELQRDILHDLLESQRWVPRESARRPPRVPHARVEVPDNDRRLRSVLGVPHARVEVPVALTHRALTCRQWLNHPLAPPSTLDINPPNDGSPNQRSTSHRRPWLEEMRSNPRSPSSCFTGTAQPRQSRFLIPWCEHAVTPLVCDVLRNLRPKDSSRTGHITNMNVESPGDKVRDWSSPLAGWGNPWQPASLRC
jgi:hypothetical protein